MKTPNILLIAAVLAALLGACTKAPAASDDASKPQIKEHSQSMPSSESQSAPQSKSQVDDEYIRKTVIDFGAKESENEKGEKVIKPTPISLYYCDQLDKESLTTMEVFSWYCGYSAREDLTDDERDSKYAPPEGVGYLTFYPAEYYEPVVMSYFDVTQEFLHDENYYDAEHNGYAVDGGGGVGHRPEIAIKSWSQGGDIVRIELSFPEMHRAKTEMVLTVKVLEDGQQFVSYMPQE